ncbi:MAG: hypothetical protein RLZZ565_1459 [Planctomycetota bacterium]
MHHAAPATRPNRGLAAPAGTLAAVAFVALAGCIADQRTPAPSRPQTVSPDQPIRRSASENRLTPDQLRELNLAFADRFTTYLINADIAVSRGNPDAEQVAIMHRLKSLGSIAVYDIVTSGDPLSQLLDLLLYTTVQSYIWIDEGEAVKIFGDRADGLIDQLRAARLDIWRVAEKALTREQLETLDNMIFRWRRDNPDLDYLAFIRFDDVAAIDEGNIVKEIRGGSGLLAPVSEAVAVADQVRQLGERGFYLSKRAPMLINWQVRDVVNTTAARPEVHQLLEAVDTLAASAERTSQAVERLPEVLATEREAAFREIEASQGELRQTMAQATETLEVVREIAGSGERLASTVQQTVDSLDRTIHSAESLVTRLEPAAPRDPDAPPPPTLAEYQATIVEATALVQSLNATLENSQGLLEADAWRVRLDEFNEAADLRVAQAADQARLVIDFATWRILIVIGAFFACLVGYRIVLARLPQSTRGGAR